MKLDVLELVFCPVRSITSPPPNGGRVAAAVNPRSST
jgi:hypothetical protein